MDIHRLLARQLSRLHLDAENPPSQSQWQEFLSKVNKTYQESDQERYLLERSMEISSREMMSLNEKLESAEQVAGLGYWYYNRANDRIFCSNAVYTILSLNPLDMQFTYDNFFKMVHPNDQEKMVNSLRNALNNNEISECELKIKNGNDNYQWYRVITHFHEGQLSGVIININKDKVAEEKIRELNQQLLVTARRAGMSEVATSILHNIGNILNSSNISINVLKENFSQSYYPKFVSIIDMLKEHLSDLPHYLLTDEKGKLIPEYLIALLEVMSQEWKKNIAEVNSIDHDLQHIKTIVAMQQTVSGVDGVMEEIYIPELFETAWQMSASKIKDKQINITKHYQGAAFIVTDKSKLLQILVNLIQNAKDAVADNTQSKSRKIRFEVEGCETDKICIKVEDNGIGISEENLQHIFSFGFTTKKNGHGFGLHSCALSAQDMGGILLANSEGEGKGAVFTLLLPLATTHRDKGVFNE